MPNRWVSQLGFLAAWLGGALLLGLWFGRPGWWVAGALAAYTAYLLRNLYLLDRFLAGAKGMPLFRTRGLWPELFARVDRLRTKARSRKKRYQKLLREVRESAGGLSDGGIVLNTDNEIVWFNAAATRLLGLDPATDIGVRIDNLLRHPDFVQYIAAPHAEGVTVPWPGHEGGWLEVQIIPYGKNERLAIVRDVTSERASERMRRDFVANASHELRSPLTVLSGYLDALAEDDSLPESWKAPIAEMQRQAERMTGILRDLIELARLEAAETDAPHEPVDAAALLEPIVRELGERPHAPDVSLSLETDAVLLGNKAEIHSIFYNLISNAVRFTPAPGTVRVVWRLEEDGGVFEVIDTGIGIPEEQIPRITERFYRVDTGRSRATGGTGLGLAIVKHALQRHNGVLSIESREGRGSTFRCRFPAARVALRGGAERAVV